MRRFIIEQGTERINGEGGLALAGLVLRDLDLDKCLNGIPIKDLKGVPEISNADVVRSYAGLLCMGRTAYEEIELYRDNDLFRNALGIKKVPSCETLRQRFDGAEGRFDPVLRELNVKLVSACAITALDVEGRKYIPLDVDVTPFDNSNSRKEHVSRTYKGCDGFAPIFAHIGEEGYILDCELRPGKQHSQRDTPEFLRRVLAAIDELPLHDEVLVRLDSGFDCQDNVVLLHGRHKYIIKRNLRKESKDDWLEVAKVYGRESEPREGKTVYVGECRRFMESKNGIAEPMRIVFEVTVRTITKKGEVLLLPDIDVNTWWTNLPVWPETVIERYHAHGTSEQYHAEIKSDMGVERLPSGKFATNSALLLVAMVSYNVLRKIGQQLLTLEEALPIQLKVKRRRVGSVVRDIIYLACKLVATGNRLKLVFGVQSPWFRPFKILYEAWAV